ncbi:MAG: M55 family metallopeptidase [Candidatus Bathyarchaeia archaeon]
MKYFISVDMEGITGIVDGTMVSRSEGDYKLGRKLMVKDVNAAIEGVLKTDPEAEITVSDAHGGMNNIEPEELHRVAELVRGRPKPQSQCSGLDDSYDACLFIGYHSKKGTHAGMMSHTYSGSNIESLHINGIEVGETAMNAGIAGYYNVPLILVTGDLAVTKEAHEIDPMIETVAVKTALGRVSARCIHPEKARDMIKEGASRAVGKIGDISAHVFDPPVNFSIRFTDAKKADAASFIPTAERIDGKTIGISNDNYIKAYHGFLAAVMCASSVS